MSELVEWKSMWMLDEERILEREVRMLSQFWKLC
jgi:hypothetical protein